MYFIIITLFWKKTTDVDAFNHPFLRIFTHQTSCIFFTLFTTTTLRFSLLYFLKVWRNQNKRYCQWRWVLRHMSMNSLRKRAGGSLSNQLIIYVIQHYQQPLPPTTPAQTTQFFVKNKRIDKTCAFISLRKKLQRKKYISLNSIELPFTRLSITYCLWIYFLLLVHT